MSADRKGNADLPVTRRFRRKKDQTHHTSILVEADRLRVHRPPSVSSVSTCSNHFLVETDYNDDIDLAIRREIERKFKRSKVNARYCFPRAMERKKQLLPIQSIARKEETRGKHKGSRSVVEELAEGKGTFTLSRKFPSPPRIYLPLPIPQTRHSSIHRATNSPICSLRVRRHRRAPSEVLAKLRSKSPYLSRDHSPHRATSQ